MIILYQQWKKEANFFQGIKIKLRIIALDFSEKKIFLSPHEPIVNLKSFQNKDYLGRIIQGTLTI